MLRSLDRAVSPKEVTPAPRWNWVIPVLSENACSPTVVTESGRVTAFMPVRLNPKSPIVVSLFRSERKLTPFLAPTPSKALPLIVTVPPRSMVSRLAARQKAHVPTVSKPSGRVSAVRAERRKASSPMVRNEVGRVTVTIPASAKALLAISVVPSGTV